MFKNYQVDEIIDRLVRITMRAVVVLMCLMFFASFPILIFFYFIDASESNVEQPNKTSKYAIKKPVNVSVKRIILVDSNGNKSVFVPERTTNTLVGEN